MRRTKITLAHNVSVRMPVKEFFGRELVGPPGLEPTEKKIREPEKIE